MLRGRNRDRSVRRSRNRGRSMRRNRNRSMQECEKGAVTEAAVCGGVGAGQKCEKE